MKIMIGALPWMGVNRLGNKPFDAITGETY